MAGFTVQRGGYTRVPELFQAIIQDLVANGFVQKFPAGPLPAPSAGSDYAPFTATLEAGSSVEPLAATQPWRIAFNADDLKGDVFVASPLQLPDDGSVSNLDTLDSGSATPTKAGLLTTTATAQPAWNPAADQTAYHFISRGNRSAAVAGSYPMTYRLSVTDHGIVLFVWEDASDSLGTRNSWLVIQRPVDHVTGQTFVTGHAPVFCVFSLNSTVMKFVVREDDVLKPTRVVSASRDSEDSHAILNEESQVAITEDNRYVITFPNGLNTPRYVYTQELDLIAYTSSDVISQYSEVPLTVYGEAAPRVYKAMSANAPNNTGMRILMLIAGKPMV